MDKFPSGKPLSIRYTPYIQSIDGNKLISYLYSIGCKRLDKADPSFKDNVMSLINAIPLSLSRVDGVMALFKRDNGNYWMYKCDTEELFLEYMSLSSDCIFFIVPKGVQYNLLWD